MDPSIPWQELNASLHASTVLSYRAGPSHFCSHCHEPDHTAEQCALSYLQPPTPPLQPPQWPPASNQTSQPARRVMRPETLERICSSWNMGRCIFLDSCKFKHICATCKRRGHKAKECDETPADSPYKTPRARVTGRDRARGTGAS